MDTIYTVYVFDSLNSNGFGHTITEHTRLTLPDGREAIESQWGTIRILDGSVRHATSMAGARQLVIDELHRRCGVIRQEISHLRTKILNEEVEVQVQA
jgi:hypothetical protein